ncbi:MAG TPA: hypothetical protein VF607_10040, partial [Verrucomicrobiae bacterium]
CSTVTEGRQLTKTDLNTLKSGYVVVAKRGNTTIAGYILADLAQRDIRVTSGDLMDKPADVDFYVTYQEHWNWDVAVYLDTLDIQFYDNKTGVMLAAGSFRNNKIMEQFPNPRDKTKEVVDCAFGQPLKP